MTQQTPKINTFSIVNRSLTSPQTLDPRLRNSHERKGTFSSLLSYPRRLEKSGNHESKSVRSHERFEPSLFSPCGSGIMVHSLGMMGDMTAITWGSPFPNSLFHFLCITLIDVSHHCRSSSPFFSGLWQSRPILREPDEDYYSIAEALLRKMPGIIRFRQPF